MDIFTQNIGGREVTLFGESSGGPILLQPVDEHDREVLESEAGSIMSPVPFTLAAFSVSDWDRELTPWAAPRPFGGGQFGAGAPETLDYILSALLPALGAEKCPVVLGGYSLAGLFALWSARQTDRFSGIAAASPSVWYPGWTDYAQNATIRTGFVYLSLGDREDRGRNPVMRTVSECIKKELSFAESSPCVKGSVLQWNPGNHFMDSDLRTARAFSWVLGNLK
ncbi:MAG: esterase [Oscillospiraceae bacterium]|nr:esterase [Oscillospiraceae bacterium]